MSEQGNDFYVGYRPLPWGHSRFLRVFIPSALWTMALLAALMVWSMRAPGVARWTPQLQEWRGVLRAEPYPMLVTGDGAPALLVAPGKHGAQRRVEGFGGRYVRVRGSALERGGRRMIEIAPGDTDLELIDEAVRVGAQVIERRPGVVRLTGEIVDGKCWSGAMKPGDGAGHRACAALCVQGGIPPLLVVPDGELAGVYLMTDAEGVAAPDLVAPCLGERVTIEGEIVLIDGLSAVRAQEVRPAAR